MMCANDTRKIFHRSIEEKRYFDESRKERREKKTFHWERERERGFGENNSTKKLFCCDWLGGSHKLFVSFSFFSSSPAFSTGCLLYRQKEWKVWFELCFETASLKERQLHSNISNYGQKNEIGEKSREIGTTKQRASRAWRWDALSPFAALLFCALLSVFIYIYIWCINLDSPNSKGVPSPNSLVPEGINL